MRAHDGKSRALQLRREARMVSPVMGAAMIGTMYFLRANCAHHGGSASGGGLISASLLSYRALGKSTSDIVGNFTDADNFWAPSTKTASWLCPKGLLAVISEIWMQCQWESLKAGSGTVAVMNSFLVLSPTTRIPSDLKNASMPVLLLVNSLQKEFKLPTIQCNVKESDGG